MSTQILSRVYAQMIIRRHWKVIAYAGCGVRFAFLWRIFWKSVFLPSTINWSENYCRFKWCFLYLFHVITINQASQTKQISRIAWCPTRWESILYWQFFCYSNATLLGKFFRDFNSVWAVSERGLLEGIIHNSTTEWPVTTSCRSGYF